MAVEKMPIGSSLRLTVQTGVDDQGEPVSANRSYNRVKPTASDEGLYQVALQLAQLQVHPLMWVQRLDQAQLLES